MIKHIALDNMTGATSILNYIRLSKIHKQIDKIDKN